LDDGTLFLRDTLHNALQSGANKIVINLGHIKYIDSSGIGELVNTYNSVTHEGGQLRLLNLSKKIWDPLIITRLLDVFDAYNDEEAALASFIDPDAHERIH
jgi:anti-sigma B factor antagonist